MDYNKNYSRSPIWLLLSWTSLLFPFKYFTRTLFLPLLIIVFWTITRKTKLNLMNMGFDLVEISRIYRLIEGARIDIPLMLVQLEQPETRKSLNRKFGHLVVPQNNQNSCHRSQNFLKCILSQLIKLCENARDTATSWANYCDPHPAKCPQFRQIQQARLSQQSGKSYIHQKISFRHAQREDFPSRKGRWR